MNEEDFSIKMLPMSAWKPSKCEYYTKIGHKKENWRQRIKDMEAQKVQDGEEQKEENRSRDEGVTKEGSQQSLTPSTLAEREAEVRTTLIHQLPQLKQT